MKKEKENPSIFNLGQFSAEKSDWGSPKMEQEKVEFGA